MTEDERLRAIIKLANGASVIINTRIVGGKIYVKSGIQNEPIITHNTFDHCFPEPEMPNDPYQEATLNRMAEIETKLSGFEPGASWLYNPLSKDDIRYLLDNITRLEAELERQAYRLNDQINRLLEELASEREKHRWINIKEQRPSDDPNHHNAHLVVGKETYWYALPPMPGANHE